MGNLTERIYLVGMPASGKTTFGQELAKALNYTFTDTDLLIERREQSSITDLFNSKGEGYFREVEKNILENTLPVNTVISTGGGAPCFFNNMNFIKKQGLTVFLDVPVVELAERSYKQHGSRPLLNNQEGMDALKEVLKKKLNYRYPFYKKAHLTLKGEQISIDYFLDELAKIDLDRDQ